MIDDEKVRVLSLDLQSENRKFILEVLSMNLNNYEKCQQIH